MKNNAKFLRFTFILLLISTLISVAQKKEPGTYLFSSEGSVSIAGKPIKYKALAGDIWVTDHQGNPVASIFSTSYFAEGITNSQKRPIIFAFNGGPGSSSIWLHFGLLGPKRVVVPSEATDDGASPYSVVNNNFSLLDIADIVMIDPVGTGYSKAINGHEDREFWGIDQDASVLSNFIRQWLTKYKRWNSPKYLLGESYGTTRAAAMTRSLTIEAYGNVALNGCIMISAGFDFQGTRPMAHNGLFSAIYLPSYTATAWYHKKIKTEQSLEELLKEAREFALGPYISALYKSKRMSSDERAAIRKKLSYFTGLSESYLDKTEMHIHPFRFMKELLREEGKTVGRLDARYMGDDFDQAGERFDNDPSMYGISAAYTSAALSYFVNDLKVDMGSVRYVFMNRSGVKPLWDWTLPDKGRWSQGMNSEWPMHINVAPYLGDEMRKNKDFRVFLGSGYYDLATPFFGPENSMYQTGMLPERVTFAYYEAGHMMYNHLPSLEKMSKDIHNFITAQNQ